MAVDDDPWKWSPVLLISPLPWALISIVLSSGGMVVLNGAATACQDPSLNAVDTSLMSSGIALGVVAAYAFLGVYAWVWLGHAVHINVPWRAQGAWVPRRVRVAKPFTQLKWVAYCYGAIAALSLCAGSLVTAGAGSVGAVCASQTPALISFSTFSFLVYWVAFGVTASRLAALTQGAKVAAALEKAGVKGNGSDQPKSDVDMVRVIFKQFDKGGDGHMESGDLGAFLDLLGMQASPERVADILHEIDGDGSGSITLAELERWYVSDASAQRNNTAASPNAKAAEIGSDEEGDGPGSDSD